MSRFYVLIGRFLFFIQLSLGCRTQSLAGFRTLGLCVITAHSKGSLVIVEK